LAFVWALNFDILSPAGRKPRRTNSEQEGGLKPETQSKQPSAHGSILVTGVSSGIGRAIALDLIKAGYSVFGSVRRLEDAASLSQAGGSRFIPLIFDVTDAASIARAVSDVDAIVGSEGLAGLVNNAGINVSGPFLHQPAEQFRQIIEINFLGLVAVTRAFLPLLGAEGKTPRARPGRIINIGSVQGIFAVPFMSAYASSKHAVEGFAQALRREMIPYGISVSTIEPNFTKSDIFAKAATDSAKHRYEGTRYEEVLAQFNAGLASEEAKAKPASSVTRKVLHALESPRPRTRYPLDPVWHIGRLLPDRMFDGLILKATGIAKLMQPKSQ
jgi:NAD(P)-dependent dehydrogenase (short-subunit alcohol dehydrogenase family)